jgi:hypothetical protein
VAKQRASSRKLWVPAPQVPASKMRITCYNSYVVLYGTLPLTGNTPKFYMVHAVLARDVDPVLPDPQLLPAGPNLLVNSMDPDSGSGSGSRSGSYPQHAVIISKLDFLICDHFYIYLDVYVSAKVKAGKLCPNNSFLTS